MYSQSGYLLISSCTATYVVRKFSANYDTNNISTNEISARCTCSTLTSAIVF